MSQSADKVFVYYSDDIEPDSSEEAGFAEFDTMKLAGEFIKGRMLKRGTHLDQYQVVEGRIVSAIVPVANKLSEVCFQMYSEINSGLYDILLSAERVTKFIDEIKDAVRYEPWNTRNGIELAFGKIIKDCRTQPTTIKMFLKPWEMFGQACKIVVEHFEVRGADYNPLITQLMELKQK